MLTLERLARDVVASWEHGDLAAAVQALDQCLREIASDRVTHQALIERAIGIHANDDIDIDPEDTFISGSGEGAFVMGWLWMPRTHEPVDQTHEHLSGCAKQPG